MDNTITKDDMAIIDAALYRLVNDYDVLLYEAKDPYYHYSEGWVIECELTRAKLKAVLDKVRNMALIAEGEIRAC